MTDENRSTNGFVSFSFNGPWRISPLPEVEGWGETKGYDDVGKSRSKSKLKSFGSAWASTLEGPPSESISVSRGDGGGQNFL